MSIQTFDNGIVIETVAVTHPRWDFRVTAVHPAVDTRLETFVSGGRVTVEAVERRLFDELAKLVEAHGDERVECDECDALAVVLTDDGRLFCAEHRTGGAK